MRAALQSVAPILPNCATTTTTTTLPTVLSQTHPATRSFSSSARQRRQQQQQQRNPIKSSNQRRADKRSDHAFWCRLVQLLDQTTVPVGSFTDTEWNDAAQILAHGTQGVVTADVIQHSWQLLERCAQEQQQQQATQTNKNNSNSTTSAWLRDSRILNRFVARWKTVAIQQAGLSSTAGITTNTNTAVVPTPGQLSRGLEEWHLPVSIATFNMIFDTAVHLSSDKLQTADTLMAYLQSTQLQPNVVTWNQYLQCTLRHSTRSFSTAVVEQMRGIFTRMQQTGVEPDVISWTLLLQAWANTGASTKAVEEMEAVLERMLVAGVVPDAFAWTTVVKHVAKSGSDEAPAKMDQLLERMVQAGVPPNVVTWSHVLSYWVGRQSGAPDQAEGVLQRMQEQGIRPNAVIWSQIIKAWVESDLVEAPAKVEAIVERMKANGIQPDVVTWSQLVKAWAISGSPEAPTKMNAILEQMKQQGCPPNDTTWNQMLSYWASSGADEAPVNVQHILKQMNRPDVTSFTMAIQACLRSGETERVEDLLQLMADAGMPPTTRTFNELLAAWCKKGGMEAVEEAEHTVGLMRERSKYDVSVAPDIWSVGMLLAVWTRSGDPTKAVDRIIEIYRQLEDGEFGFKPDYVMCSTVVSFLAKSGRRDALERADAILRRFLESHDARIVEGQYDVYGRLVRGWVQKKELRQAGSLLQHWQKFHTKGKVVPVPDFHVFRLLTLGWIESGDLEKADAVFRQWQVLFTAGHLAEGPNKETSAKLVNGWRKLSRSGNLAPT